MQCVPVQVSCGLVNRGAIYVKTKNKSVYRLDRSLPNDQAVITAAINAIKSRPKLSLKGWTRVR
jgi:hypothetical protein